jgi:hypothetical protein
VIPPKWQGCRRSSTLDVSRRWGLTRKSILWYNGCLESTQVIVLQCGCSSANEAGRFPEPEKGRATPEMKASPGWQAVGRVARRGTPPVVGPKELTFTGAIGHEEFQEIGQRAQGSAGACACVVCSLTILLTTVRGKAKVHPAPLKRPTHAIAQAGTWDEVRPESRIERPFCWPTHTERLDGKGRK